VTTNSPSPPDSLPPPKKLISSDGRELAYRYQPGQRELPAVIFLPGYTSDMTGTKAQFLAETCAARNQSSLLFDYSGNGSSGGKFEDGTIGDWIDDALAVIDGVTQENLVLVGSSMGGWIGLHCAMKRPARIKAFVGIAAAPDFTDELRLQMSEEDRRQCQKNGYFEIPGYLGSTLRLYDGLMQDGHRHLLLDKPIPLSIPVTLLQGREDKEVPWETAYKIKDRITPSVAEIVMIEDGDHRLSRPQDLEILDRTVRALSEKVQLRRYRGPECFGV
jgi:pimeloyl-ACP methyl ester carboxylesterase